MPLFNLPRHAPARPDYSGDDQTVPRQAAKTRIPERAMGSSGGSNAPNSCSPTDPSTRSLLVAPQTHPQAQASGCISCRASQEQYTNHFSVLSSHHHYIGWESDRRRIRSERKQHTNAERHRLEQRNLYPGRRICFGNDLPAFRNVLSGECGGGHLRQRNLGINQRSYWREGIRNLGSRYIVASRRSRFYDGSRIGYQPRQWFFNYHQRERHSYRRYGNNFGEHRCGGNRLHESHGQPVSARRDVLQDCGGNTIRRNYNAVMGNHFYLFLLLRWVQGGRRRNEYHGHTERKLYDCDGREPIRDRRCESDDFRQFHDGDGRQSLAVGRSYRRAIGFLDDLGSRELVGNRRCECAAQRLVNHGGGREPFDYRNRQRDAGRLVTDQFSRHTLGIDRNQYHSSPDGKFDYLGSRESGDIGRRQCISNRAVDWNFYGHGDGNDDFWRNEVRDLDSGGCVLIG